MHHAPKTCTMEGKPTRLFLPENAQRALAGVEGEHEPVLDEQHLEARVRAKHLEHGLDVLERLALDRPVTHTHSSKQSAC